jgi:hypothetical protein
MSITKSTKTSSKRKSPPPLRTSLSSAQLLAAFLRLIAHPDLQAALKLTQITFYERIFTVWATLWLFLLQRLKTDSSLDGLVCDVHNGLADHIRPKTAARPPSQRLRSNATPSLCGARKRLPQSLFTAALAAQAKEIWAQAQGLSWHDLRVILLDGSTVRLRPEGDIAQRYPAHASGKSGYWCLMRVVVGFCLYSGAAVATAFASKHIGEQALACSLMISAPLSALYLGDRNFGVFRIVQTARYAKSHVLVRLTDVRARKLLGKKRLVPGDYQVSWAHSCHDTLQEGCSAEPIKGRLIVVRLDRSGWPCKRLCLFTTLLDCQLYTLPQLVALYGQRWQVEINLRHLKTQMNLRQLKCKSADMCQKEWLAGLLAYNLIRSVMVGAAAQNNLSVQELSFSGARRRVLEFVRQWGAGQPHLSVCWKNLLTAIAAGCPLPKRKKPRPNEPRLQRLECKKFGILRGSRDAARRRLNKNFTPKTILKS